MKKKYLIFSLILILQIYPKSLHTSSFKNWYNTNYVTDIMSTDNKIVIGSSKGLIIFTPEDTNFVTLNNSDNLLDNCVSSLEGANGNIWLFSPSGITILSVDTTNLREIPSSFSGIEGEPETGLLNGDTLFLGTTQFLYIWDTEGDPFNTPWSSNNSYNLRNYSINILFLMDDTLYVGTNGGLCQIPYNSFSDTTQWVWNTVADGLPDDTVTAVTSWKNELWIGTKNGIVSGDMNNWTTRNVGLWSREINGFSSLETLWVATEDAPHYWNDSSLIWVPVYQGLHIKKITGISSDNTGKIWIGIDGDGIAFLDDTLWNIIRLPGPSSSNFSDIAIDKNGDIWGVHYNGFFFEASQRTISHYHNGEWVILNDTNELGISGRIRWVDVDQQGNKWFGLWALGTEIDILKLSENGDWDSLALPVSGVVGSQFIDSKGNKWFSNFLSSVCKLSPDDSTWQVYTDENYLNFIVAFAEDSSGNIYFGSSQRGLSVLKTDNTWLKVGGLPSEQINDLAFDNKGDLWVGTTFGLGVVRNFVTIKHYTHTTSGLLGDNVMDIYIDWKGNKWFEVENKGVSVLRYNGEWDSITVDDGLASDFIIDDLDGLTFDAKNGYLWIATRDGITRYETGAPGLSPDLTDIDVYPNPFIPRQHSFVTFSKIPDDAKIYIYSISLKRIKTVDKIEEATHRAFWDGKDESGKPVDSGIYIYLIINQDGNKKTGKIAVIR